MRKALIGLFVLLLLLTSCRAMKRLKVVKVPKTVKEKKMAERDAKSSYEEGRYVDTVDYLRALIKKYPKADWKMYLIR